MVIGNGLVAQRFSQYISDDSFLVFASGVSNSKTKNSDAYIREFDLLKDSIKKNESKILIYFSTCSIYDPYEKDAQYVQHKLQLEAYIKGHVKQFYIFRVSNLVGSSTNPNTVFNFFFNHIKNGVNFDLWVNACRNIIDIDDAYFIIDYIIKQCLFQNQVVNIANPANYSVSTIISAIEAFLNIKSNYIVIKKGICFDVDTTSIQPILQKLSIVFDTDYLKKQLNKYY